MRVQDAIPDILGGYLAEDIALGPDADGAVRATLISRQDPLPGRRAVLYLHGYNDYFFQAEMASPWEAAGFAFFALDLRRHGRSLRPGQLLAYTQDLRDYFEEIREALRRIRARGHDRLVLSGHSTGALTAALFAAEEAEHLQALVLNAPFLAFAGRRLDRFLLDHVVPRFGALDGRIVVQADTGPHYAWSLHEGFGRGGEWSYDLTWKTSGGLPLRAGWVGAAARGHGAVRRGLGVSCPVLVLTSLRSLKTPSWDPRLLVRDGVLDVQAIRALAPRIGPRVEQLVVVDALHDVILSRGPVRRRAYTAMTSWADRVLK